MVTPVDDETHIRFRWERYISLKVFNFSQIFVIYLLVVRFHFGLKEILFNLFNSFMICFLFIFHTKNLLFTWQKLILVKLAMHFCPERRFCLLSTYSLPSLFDAGFCPCNSHTSTRRIDELFICV